MIYLSEHVLFKNIRCQLCVPVKKAQVIAIVADSFNYFHKK